MTNFEYLKSLDNEYKMADIIMDYFGEHHKELLDNKEPIIHGLPFLKWLQEERKTTTN